MDAFFVLLIIGAILYFCAKIRDNLEKHKKDTDQTRKYQPDEEPAKKRQLEDEYDVEADYIRDEIRAQIKKQAPAVRILQALSRVDGTSSKAEQNLIFECLNRNGARLSYERHRPHFSDSVSGEWNYAAESDDFGRMITPLSSMPLPYRIDVFATAQAIVAIGGAPRKREAEALDLLRGLIREKESPSARVDDEYEGPVYIIPKQIT